MSGGSAEPTAPAALLAELFEAVSARSKEGLLECLAGGGCPASAGSQYPEIRLLAPDSEPAARAVMAPLVDRACADLAAVRAAARDDPAAPEIEAACHYLLRELSWLAAVYITVSADGRTPDPGDEYSAEYSRTGASIRELLELMGAQRDLWRFFRESRAASRARPPPRRRPRRPLADDREYYF